MDLRRFVAPVAVGVVVAAVFGLWGFTARHSATADVVEGWAMPNANGTAIALQDSNDSRAGNSYIVVGASWADRDGMWHDGADGPTCVGTDTASRTHVRLGIVDVEAGQEGIGGPRVVWLRCLDLVPQVALPGASNLPVISPSAHARASEGARWPMDLNGPRRRAA